MKDSKTSLAFVLECLCQLAMTTECTRAGVAKKIDAFYRGQDANDYEESGKLVDFLPTTDFEIQCCGRDTNNKECLLDPITVKVHVTLMEDGKSLHASTSDCPFACGSHGGLCKANTYNELKPVLCPYSVEMPYMIDNCHIIPKVD